MKFLLTALLLTLMAGSSMAQAPPAGVYVGAMFKEGTTTKMAVQVMGNINVISKSSEGEVTGQVYFRPAFFYSSSEPNEMQALAGYVVGEVWLNSKLSVATGMGLFAQITEGDDPWRAPLLTEFGYQPISKMKITAGAQFFELPDDANLVYVYTGVSIFLK